MMRLSAVVCLLAVIVGTPAAAAEKPVVVAIEAVAGTFRATLSDGTTRAGTELAGMTLVYARGAETLRIRVAGIRPDPADKTGRLLLHDFRVAETDAPFCAPSVDGLREGYAVPGRSQPDGIMAAGDAGDFELACTSGAQGKCLRFGYAPWETGPDGRSNRDRYNACIRMVRADYCGNGVPTTRDGTLIDIFDDAGIQRSERLPDFTFEAAWTPAGAVCVAHPRIRENISLEALAASCPRLIGKLGPDQCRQGSTTGDVYNASR